MKIYLIGFMGCGKSVLGKRLASKLNMEFYDLDLKIEEKYKMTVPSIFSRFDEKVFRKIESEMLQNFSSSDGDFVMSCGGGTPCFNDNMTIINSSGVSVYIKLNAKTLTDRLLKSKTNRPLIKNIPPDQLLPRISELLEKREVFYNQAKIVIDGINLKPEDILVKLSET
ncbi:MAG TPA: shikimate kinase [Bacteroidales bacterium]|nr:shikimate kinase [Bacteroidales bacterium]